MKHIISWLSLFLWQLVCSAQANEINPGAGQVVEDVIPEVLLEQVESGHAESAFFIASAFAAGTMGIERNLEKAKEWFMKSAEMGYVHGMFEIGNLLFHDATYGEAKNWFEKAAAKGHGESFYRLSIFTLYELDGEVFDCDKAYELLTQAQQRDVKPAFNDHAWMLATLPDRSCRNGQKAWRIFADLQNLYAPNEAIPWAYLDTKAAVLAEIADYNEAIEIQSWIVEDFCDVEFPAAENQRSGWINALVDQWSAQPDDVCYGAAQRLQAYLQRTPWREKPVFK